MLACESSETANAQESQETVQEETPDVRYFELTHPGSPALTELI